ncbi:DUF167 domain-containing protein [Chloroflexota bacterium]
MKEKLAIIKVKIQPNASCNRVMRFRGDILHLKISAPPIRGKANHELINFLSEILGVARTNLIVEKGVTSKHKVITIKSLSQSQVAEQLLNP